MARRSLPVVDGSSELSSRYGRVYLRYGRLMHQVQIFELAVRGLVNLTEPPTERPIDDSIDQLFRRPLGKLAKSLGADDAFGAALETAVNTRNTLAHTYLLEAALRLNSDASTEDDEVALLDEVYEKYLEVNRRIDKLTEREYLRLGLDQTGGLTDDEVAALIREVSG
jgi:hypothetical protein